MKRIFFFLLIAISLTFLFTACDETNYSKDEAAPKHSFQAYHEILTKSAAEQLSGGITRTDVEAFWLIE